MPRIAVLDKSLKMIDIKVKSIAESPRVQLMNHLVYYISMAVKISGE